MPTYPTGITETILHSRGVGLVAGVDEAGAGALAGPVVAAAVVLPAGHGLAVRDSKTLSQQQRERLYDQIVAMAIDWAVALVHVDEIDRSGIRPANLSAMRRAVESLKHVDHVLVDAHTVPGLLTPQTAIIRGDASEHCIAAASIVAKVTRDRFMTDADTLFPLYQFKQHKGYGTEAHRRAVVEHGRCPLHRSSFTIVV